MTAERGMENTQRRKIKYSIGMVFVAIFTVFIAVSIGMLNTYPTISSRDVVASTKQSALMNQVTIMSASLSALEQLSEDGVEQVMLLVDAGDYERVLVTDPDGVVLYDRGGKYPNPAKSTAYSLLLPGLGQIYNGEAWKVPIYWGMMAGGVHFYLDNKLQYERWKWIHNQATTTDEVEERPPQSGETAKYYRDVFRRYRDYSMLFIALSYILQAVDANVFAYMHGFEVNDDISLRVEPALIPYNQYAALPPAVGLSFGIRF